MTSNFVALIYEEDYTALPQGPKDSPGCVKNDSNSTNFTNFETVRPTTVSPTVDHVDWEIERDKWNECINVIKFQRRIIS